MTEYFLRVRKELEKQQRTEDQGRKGRYNKFCLGQNHREELE